MSLPESSSEMEDDNNGNSPVILDSGDVRLLVSYSNQSLALLGSSQVLSIASPVWNKILNPPFPKLVSKEGGNNNIQDKQIDFSEDDAEALLLLLRIAHLQFSKVPSTLEFDAILNVAILCDKYDCVGVVKPWLPLWLMNEETRCNEPGYKNWLFIAWVFGREKLFGLLAKKLLREMKTNEEGESLASTGEVLSSQMPLDIIENIMSIRHDTIKDLLKLPYDCVDRFEKNKIICFASKKKCDLMMYGSLLIGLRELGLWPRQSPDTINISVQDLASQLSSLEIIQFSERYGHDDHYNCVRTIALADKIASLLSSIPDPVLQSQCRQMGIQSRK